MSIQTVTSGPFETNAYILSCPSTNEAAIIDAPPYSEPEISKYIESAGLTPRYLLFTHSHWDHTTDAAQLIKRFSIPALIHPLDAPNLQEPGSDGLPCWIAVQGVKPNRFLAEGDTLDLGTMTLHVIHTPGHTPGGVCFYLPEQKLLFSGDTLFKGTIGNLSFPTAQPELMWKSLAKLAKLPPDTRVFPGHGEPTTIGQESWLSRAKTMFG